MKHKPVYAGALSWRKCAFPDTPPSRELPFLHTSIGADPGHSSVALARSTHRVVSAGDLLPRFMAHPLFVTHYFELTEMDLPGLRNAHLDALTQDDQVVFLHRVESGPAAQSYGLAVARLAGVPDPVVQRARQRLRQLEASSRSSLSHTAPAQLSLFQAAPHPAVYRLSQVEPDQLSPRQALDLVYALKELARQDGL